jgi:AAA+ superfamily predicted ATPase
LQDRKLQILELMAKASSGRQVSKGEGGKEQRETHEEKPNAALSAELSSIDKEIKELKDSISLDSILTILDGPIEVRGRIIVATTNFPDKIDRALLRKGRIDMQLNLDTFNKEEMVELLTMIYQEAPPKKVANKFVLDKWTPVMIINKATTVPKEQCYEELSADPVEGIDF